PIHAHDPDPVIANGADGSGHVRGVVVDITLIPACYRIAAGIVKHMIVVVCKVPSIDIVDKAVAVVVDSVAGNFAGIGPDICGQVRMSNIDAFIDYSDDDASAAR